MLTSAWTGPAGLSSLKELREVGFNVTVFERRSEVGGIFTFDADPSITSATHWTRSQLSKYIVSIAFNWRLEHPS